MKKFVFGLWFLTTISLFFYSYTQVDLNLTISRIPLVNSVIKTFQSVGYFQRPLSTTIFLVLILLLYTLYFILLFLSKRGKFTRKEFWLLAVITSVILLFSYPAFSYDIFNYMFDAKTIVYYGQNPWHTRPLDFVGDPWLSFMHWTHRPSVYPPVWIFLTLPFYFFGFNIFLFILFNFKLLMTASFLGTVWILEKLIENRKDKLMLLSFYAFNPLMLIENVVSGHNDIVMMFFALLSVWFLIKTKRMLAVICYLLAILIKYVTGVLLPIFLIPLLKKKFPPIIIYRIGLILMMLALLYMLTGIEIQPWYLVWLMPFIVLSGWKFLYPITIGFSLGLLLRYAPFLYFGNWDPPVNIYKFWLILIPLFVSIFFSFFIFLRSKLHLGGGRLKR